jgi:hypothetical protein
MSLRRRKKALKNVRKKLHRERQMKTFETRMSYVISAILASPF